MNLAPKVIVEGKCLSKAFNGNVVLKDVSIQCTEGSAIALVGENGAGKSTLMNLLSGSYVPTSGSIEVDGEEVHFTSPTQAKEKGIAFVHQELSLLDGLTVGENIMLGCEPRTKGFLRQKELHAQATQVLEEIGYQIDVTRLVGDLVPAERQITEIAKAWQSKPRLVIFDEPTSSLNKAESDILFAFIQKIQQQGVAIIMISHRMDDIFSTCNEIIVLKDGEFVFHSAASETNTDELISKMVGRTFTNVYPARNEQPNANIRVHLENVSMNDAVKDVTLAIPRGTVVGIGGLDGQGQRELSRALFGIEPFTAGTYKIDGKTVHIRSPHDAVKHKIAFVPDDRKAEGLALTRSVQENILSLVLSENTFFGFLKKKKIEALVKDCIEQLNIKVSDPRMLVNSLSGGNQQKIVFSKWMQTQPDILYLHEPTRGVDVQSKLEIYTLIRTLTAKGVSVVVFTSDMLELIGLSDEIYVMYEGRISGHIQGKDATEEKIMQYSASASKEEEK